MTKGRAENGVACFFVPGYILTASAWHSVGWKGQIWPFVADHIVLGVDTGLASFTLHAIKRAKWGE